MTFTRFGTHNAVLPKAGPKAYPFLLDFTALTEQTIDMQPEISAGNVDFVSGVYVDNRLNQNSLEIVVPGVNQSVGIAAGKQSYMPLLVGDMATLIFRTVPNLQLIIPCHVVNFPVWPIVF